MKANVNYVQNYPTLPYSVILVNCSRKLSSLYTISIILATEMHDKKLLHVDRVTYIKVSYATRTP